MDIKIYEVEKFNKIPDIHGALYDAIEEFKPKSQEKLENDIKSFLDYTDPEKIKKNLPITATMLIAPWGLGKTTAYDVIIQNLLKKEGYNGKSIKVRAQDISNYYDTFKNTKVFKLFPGNADRFLYLILKLIVEDPNFKKILPNEFLKLEGRSLIEKIITHLHQEFSFLVVFIDELEEVVKNKNDIIPFILKSIKDLLNGSSNIVNNKSHKNFLSFIMACTDAAIYEVSRLEDLEYQYGGIKRRIPEIDIKNISMDESIEYLVKLNKFCYNSQFIKCYVNPGASFNTIARMVMRNPGHMKSAFTILMNKSASLHKGSLMYQIDGKFILENLENYKLEYMETQRRAISNEIFNNWLKKYRENSLIANLIALFIGEIKPFSFNELNERFDEELHENEFLSVLQEFNHYINSIHSNIREAIIPVYLFRSDFTSADFQNLIKLSGFTIETLDDFNLAINFKADGILPLEEFLDVFSYYEVNKNGDIFRKFFFTTDLDILKQILPHLSNITLKTLNNKLKKEFDSSLEYYVINPSLFNIIFPLPIPKEFNLLDDKNENVRIWTEISRRKKTEIYKKNICKIIYNYLFFQKLISKSLIENFNSEFAKVDQFKYYEDMYDKDQFLVLKNYLINDFSNFPINLMIWREIGDYNNEIANDILLKINKFQKKEYNNIHILILLSQSKIPENIIIDLSDNLNYTIVKELPLSQFDITKFAFLDEIYNNYKSKYDEKKFEKASKQLIMPFKEIFISIKENITSKGINIKLNTYMSNLTEIPQLMKYVLYDFLNDFSNWAKVTLQKPFEKINPIGLSPRYSSSIDDWSEDRLRGSISEFLLTNGFVRIEENVLKVSMPPIEANILKMIQDFDRDGIKLKIDELHNFFFDISNNPALFKDVFLTDLENRGLIDLKGKEKLVILVKFDISQLQSDLDDLRDTINRLKIKDQNFYHIFTIKQKGYSIIYLNYFLDVLQNLINLKDSKNSNIHFEHTKFILFKRIYKVCNDIINHIFLPLDVAISNVESKLSKLTEENLNTEFINLKLKEYGCEEIDIENFLEIKEFRKKFDSLIKSFSGQIDKEKLEEDIKFYHKIHKKDVRVAGEPFSYLKLTQNKLKEDFKPPFLNFLYRSLDINISHHEEDEVIKEIEMIHKLIKEVDYNYRGIKGQISKVSLSDTDSVAYIIYKKLKDLSEFKFVKTSRKIDNLKEVREFLFSLNTDVQKVISPITQILKREGRGKPKSLLDKIYESEGEITKTINILKERINFLNEKQIPKDEKTKNKLINATKEFDYIKIKQILNECKDLSELSTQSNEIYRKLQFEISKKQDALFLINENAIEYFENFKDLNSLKLIFKSLGMGGYEKVIDNYLNSIRRLQQKDVQIPFHEIVNQLISHRNRIEEGHNKTLKEELPEIAQKLYKALYDKYSRSSNFSEKDLLSLAKHLNLDENDLENAMDELFKKNLLEKRFHFIS